MFPFLHLCVKAEHGNVSGSLCSLEFRIRTDSLANTYSLCWALTEHAVERKSWRIICLHLPDFIARYFGAIINIVGTCTQTLGCGLTNMCTGVLNQRPACVF